LLSPNPQRHTTGIPVQQLARHPKHLACRSDSPPIATAFARVRAPSSSLRNNPPQLIYNCARLPGTDHRLRQRQYSDNTLDGRTKLVTPRPALHQPSSSPSHIVLPERLGRPIVSQPAIKTRRTSKASALPKSCPSQESLACSYRARRTRHNSRGAFSRRRARSNLK